MHRHVAPCAMVFALAVSACGSETSPPGSSGTTSSTTTTTSSSSSSSSSTSTSAAAGAACADAGGMCGCAGGCQLGYHPADPAHDDCPQPCDQCGGCSMACCLPDADAGADGGDAG